MAADEILLRRRGDRTGFDVDYRPSGSTAWLLGCDVDEALRRMGDLHGRLGLAHQIAFARAVSRSDVSPAREAAWDTALLAQDAAIEARRCARGFASVSLIDDLVEPVLASVDELMSALNVARNPRDRLAPRLVDCELAAGRLACAMTALVVRLSALMPARLDDLDPGAREIVASATETSLLLLRRLRHSLPDDIDRLDAERALSPVLEAEGAGSAMTSSGRITYGVRVAAGCISRIGCTTPTERLFKPGGAGVHLLDRFDGDADALDMVMASLDPDACWALVGAGADA